MKTLNLKNIMLDMELNEADKHALRLGKLVANFHSLEFVLRAFLLNAEGPSKSSVLQSTDLNALIEGETVPENAFTNYDTLGDLMDKYNNNPKIVSAKLTINKDLVRIRDAIAHGRVSGSTPSSTLNLLKFDKPEKGKVKVTFSILMTKEWFSEQVTRVYKAILRVNEANDRLQSGRL